MDFNTTANERKGKPTKILCDHSPRSLAIRTDVRAGGAQRQQCYIGYLSGGVTGADAACGTDPGCWRGNVGNAIDKANFSCINK